MKYLGLLLILLVCSAAVAAPCMQCERHYGQRYIPRPYWLNERTYVPRFSPYVTYDSPLEPYYQPAYRPVIIKNPYVK